MMRPSVRGLSLIELLVTVTIAGVLAAIAIPNLRETIAKRRLDGAANELSADLQYARSQSVADNWAVRLTSTSGSTYTITGGVNGAQTYKSATLPTGITTTSGQSATFMALRGCLGSLPVLNSTGQVQTPGQVDCNSSDVTFTLSSSGTTGTASVVVNNMGRVRICSSNGFGGYPSC